MHNILVGVMVKNSERWLPGFLELLDSLEYPDGSLRVVFEYGKSTDSSLKLLKEYKERSRHEVEIYLEPSDPYLKLHGSHAAGSVLSDYQELMRDDEDYFLMLDSHICSLPSDYVLQLLDIGADIAAPFVWNEGYTHFYDTWSFRIDNLRFSPKSPPRASYPFEVDSVGTTWLATRRAFLNTPVSVNTLSFFYNARKLAFDVVVDPSVEVIHSDLIKHGIYKAPPPAELGYYPRNGYVDHTFPIAPYKKRSKLFHLKTLYNRYVYEYEIYAMDLFASDPRAREKGLLWCKKFSDMSMFFCTSDKSKIRAMYGTEMYPRYIEIELSNICPFKCRWCERTYLDEEPRLMSWKEFLLIMHNFPNLAQISFTGIGEAWTNPIFLDCIKYIKERGVFFEQYDNLQFITRERAEKLVKYGVERLIISLDAATKETYENLRVGHKWDKMLDGLRYIKEAKKKYKRREPDIGIHFVINKANVHEALKVLDLAKELGVDFVFYNRLLHYYKEIDQYYMEIPESLRQQIIDRATELGVRVSINQPAQAKLPPLNTCVAIFQPFFLVNGDVITCCAQHEGNRRDWEKAMKMGNIFEAKDFRKIWYGKRYRHLRKLLSENRLPEYCIDCPVYQWKGHKVHKAVPLE